MKVIPFQIPRDSNIFLVGDAHEGSVHRDTVSWGKMIDMVHSEYEGCKNNFVIDHGDAIEAITIDDPRYHKESVKELKDNIIEQMAMAISQRQPIKDNMVCLLQGNHERKWHNKFGDISRFIAEGIHREGFEFNGIGTQYGTYSAIIVYRDMDGRFLFRHHAHHGFGSLRSQAKDPDQELANKLASLKQKLKGLAGNCLLHSMGHTHQLLVNKPKEQLLEMEKDGKITREYATAKKKDGYIHPDYRWYVNTGSFTRLYADSGISGYAEVAGYKSADCGFAIVQIRDGNLLDIERIKLT